MAKVFGAVALALSGVAGGCQICEFMGNLTLNGTVATPEHGNMTCANAAAHVNETHFGDEQACRKAQLLMQSECCDGEYTGPKECDMCSASATLDLLPHLFTLPGTEATNETNATDPRNVTCGELNMAMWLGIGSIYVEPMNATNETYMCPNVQEVYSSMCCLNATDTNDTNDTNSTNGTNGTNITETNDSNDTNGTNDSNDTVLAATNTTTTVTTTTTTTVTTTTTTTITSTTTSTTAAAANGTNATNGTAGANATGTGDSNDSNDSVTTVTTTATMTTTATTTTTTTVTNDTNDTAAAVQERMRGSFTAQVDNPADFAGNSSKVGALKDVIVGFLGVPESWVSVETEVVDDGSRRLGYTFRRLADVLKVMYTVVVPADNGDAALSADSLAAKMSFAAGDATASALASAIESATGETVSILSVEEPTVARDSTSVGSKASSGRALAAAALLVASAAAFRG